MNGRSVHVSRGALLRTCAFVAPLLTLFFGVAALPGSQAQAASYSGAEAGFWSEVSQARPA